MTAILPSPLLVGCFQHENGSAFLPVSAMEIQRASDAFGFILDSFLPARNRVALLVSPFEGAAQAIPMAKALADRNFVLANAEASPFDIPRIESMLRRFDPGVVIAIGLPLAETLRQNGFDPAALLKDRLVWLDDAVEGSAPDPEGAMVRRFRSIGPAMAFECAALNGLHIDSIEWSVAASDDGIDLTSRLPRALPFVGHRVGTAGRLVHTPCPCGNSHPRLVYDRHNTTHLFPER